MKVKNNDALKNEKRLSELEYKLKILNDIVSKMEQKLRRIELMACAIH